MTPAPRPGTPSASSSVRPHDGSTLSTLAAATLQPDKYSTQARLYLNKYRTLQTLADRFISTASSTCTKYLHHGCLCFVAADLATCHCLIRELDTLSGATLDHSRRIAEQSFAASERSEQLRRRRDRLSEGCSQLGWELIARECQVDAQVNRWNGIVMEAMRTRELPAAGRVGLMMCHARWELAERAAKKQGRRTERVRRKLAVLEEKVTRAWRTAGFLAEYDDCLQSLQWHVDLVARGIEERLNVMVAEAGETWGRKWEEHRKFQAVAGDTLECPSCLYERWSGPMEFGNRVGWFEGGVNLEEESVCVMGRERASSL